jgi:hypothetical protein
VIGLAHGAVVFAGLLRLLGMKVLEAVEHAIAVATANPIHTVVDWQIG